MGGAVRQGGVDDGIEFHGAVPGGAVAPGGGTVVYGSNAGAPNVAPVPVVGSGVVAAPAAGAGAAGNEGTVVLGSGVVPAAPEGTGTMPPLVGGGGAPGNWTR